MSADDIDSWVGKTGEAQMHHTPCITLWDLKLDIKTAERGNVDIKCNVEGLLQLKNIIDEALHRALYRQKNGIGETDSKPAVIMTPRCNTQDGKIVWVSAEISDLDQNTQKLADMLTDEVRHYVGCTGVADEIMRHYR